MDAHVVMPAPHMLMTMVFAGAGGLAGYLHLKLLALNVRALLSPSHDILAIAASLARGAVTIAALALAAFHGALPLVAALAGFLAVRTALVRHPEILLP